MIRLFKTDEKNISSPAGQTAYASENYQAKEIRFGGLGISALAEDLGQLEIEDIKSESFLKGEEGESKILVVYSTNKPARTKISFAKADGQGEKTFEEKFYDKSHAVVLPRADSGTTYHYEITARDRSGNEKKSGTFAIYSGKKEMSIFDIIAGAFRDVFGWTGKVN